MSNDRTTVTIRRATLADEAAAWAIVEEYNVTFGVVVADDAASFRKYLDGPGALWLAQDGEAIAGCVVLRPLPEMGSHACEVKRLYVRPSHRGAHLADTLMDALEAHARAAGFDAIYLDSRPDFETAIRLYRRRGYHEIERYNDNPEATIFMRLDLLGSL